MALIDTLIAQFQEAQKKANAANEARYAQAIAEYDKIIELYSPEGAFGKGFEAQLERGRTKALAQGTQQLVSSGLYGTTVAAGLGKKFEEEVAVPARLQAEALRTERLAEARAAKAGLIERREDVGPDYGLLAQLAMQASSAPRYVVSGPSDSSGESSFPKYEPPKTPMPSAPEEPWWSVRDRFNRREIEAAAARKARLAQPVPPYSSQMRMTDEELMKAVTVVPSKKKQPSYEFVGPPITPEAIKRRSKYEQVKPGVWYSGW